jgi:hypothetical protein
VREKNYILCVWLRFRLLGHIHDIMRIYDFERVYDYEVKIHRDFKNFENRSSLLQQSYLFHLYVLASIYAYILQIKF